MFSETNFIGPVTGGPHHPYFQVWFYIEDVSCSNQPLPQSERLDLYRTYAKKLIDASLPLSSPLRRSPVLKPAVLAKFSQAMRIGVSAHPISSR